MTKPNTPADGAPDEIVTEAHGDAHGFQAGQPGQAAQGGDQDEPDRLSLLEAEKTDLKDKLLRTLADMENLRRRTEREVADARAYAVTSFARDLLTVGDNLRRAIDAVPAEARDNEAVKALVEGVELTERDFLKTMDRHGVKKLEPEGAKFDPNLHQAMFEVQDATVPSGTVMQVVQTGYAIGGRVLRPAMVGVAKGGPKAAPEPGAANGEASQN